jgi:type I restriction enzyme M protein
MAKRKQRNADPTAYPRPRSKNEKKQNGTTDLIKELWQAAVNLRGSIEPADYKRYVLPIVFLRFLSLRYEKRRAELTQLVREPKSEYYTENPRARKALLDDKDEYESAGAFVLPKQAQWDEIVRHAQADDIKVRLDDALEALENAYPQKLRGLLPRIYAGSNLARENVTSLINLFSKEIFKLDHDGEDLIGRVYEYFIGEFANSEGKRGGEYFTPLSIVRTLVAMLEPTEGVVFDPCCGSGGMFVQSDVFAKHSGKLSFVGQESKAFTYRLCRMNLFIHGLNGDIRLGNSYVDDQFSTLKADYVLANPPFNDGSKGERGWGADRISDKDPRLMVAGERMPLSPRNANPMWMLHFLHHLKDGGTAGFVMATGELSDGEVARLSVRKALVQGGFIDCIVQLPSKLFANTPIGCSLWFLSRDRDGRRRGRARKDEVLFVSATNVGTLIAGSRKQKTLAAAEVARIAGTYAEFKGNAALKVVPGFCRVASIEEIRGHNFALTPGRYTGAETSTDESVDVREALPHLKSLLLAQMAEGERLAERIKANLSLINVEADD